MLSSLVLSASLVFPSSMSLRKSPCNSNAKENNGSLEIQYQREWCDCRVLCDTSHCAVTDQISLGTFRGVWLSEDFSRTRASLLPPTKVGTFSPNCAWVLIYKQQWTTNVSEREVYCSRSSTNKRLVAQAL